MRPIAPRLNVGEEITVAEEQPQFKPLTMARVPIEGGGHYMVARWTLTPDERQRIAAGEDIYVRFPEHTYPHTVSLRPEWAR